MHQRLQDQAARRDVAPGHTGAAATMPAGLRAADADRRRTVAELERHFVDGRLSQDELGERVAQALAARTYGELDALLGDLPRSLPPRGDEPTVAAPRARPGSDRGFRSHLTSYALVMALLVTIWLLTTPGGYFWPIWPMLGWGIGVASHGLGRGAGCRSRGRAGTEAA